MSKPLNKPANAESVGGEAAQVLGEGRYLRLVRRGRWEFVERIGSSGVVGIIATTPDGRLLLVEQWREAAGALCIELPAGLVGDEDGAEHAAESAKRELEEETGYRAGWIEHAADGLSSAGMTGECVQLFRTGGLQRVGKGGGVAGERIEVHAVPVAEVPGFIADRQRAGRKVDVKVWAALWFLGR